MSQAATPKPTISRRRDFWEMIGITYACAAFTPLVAMAVATLGLGGWAIMTGTGVALFVWLAFLIATYLRHPARGFVDLGRLWAWIGIVVSQVIVMFWPVVVPAAFAWLTAWATGGAAVGGVG